MTTYRRYAAQTLDFIGIMQRRVADQHPGDMYRLQTRTGVMAPVRPT
jgi:hypothetical protein